MHRRILATLLLLAPLGIGQDAAKRGSDLVIVIDLSSSMRKNEQLPRARQLIQELMEEVVGPGSQVAVVPFGSGVHEITRFEAGNDEGSVAEVRARVNRTIEGLRPRDSYSYLGAALEAGLETLHEFKEKNPARSRHLVLVSDGPQSVGDGDPAPALPDVIAGWEAKDMKAPADWYLWYTYFGEPEDALSAALEKGGAGRAVPLDRLDDLHWTFTRVSTKKTDLGAKGGSGWTARIPFTARSSGGAAGRRLRFSVAGTFPGGMKVTVSPREMVLVGRSTEIELQLICTGARAGAYEDVAILVEGDGLLHLAAPRRLPLRFRVGEPRITIKDAQVDLGRVAPGATASGTVALVPNEDAASAPPKVQFKVTRAPAGVTVAEAPAKAKEGELALGFTVKVPADAKEGNAECRLKLDAGDTELSAHEVRVVFQVAPPRVAVAGALKLEAAVGEDVSGEIALVPDAAAAAIAPEVRAEVKEGLPAGMKIETPAVVAKGNTALPVRVSVASDVPPGDYKAALTLSASGVRVEPSEIWVDVSVVRAAEPPQLKLPASLDLGDVPRDHAGELVGTFHVDMPEGYPGTSLVLEGSGAAKIVSEPVALVIGPNEVEFRIRPASLEPGEQVEFMRVLARRDRRARESGMIALRWRVTDGKLVVKDVKKPEPLPFRGGTASTALTLETNEDLKGKQVSMNVSLDGLPDGMTVTMGAATAQLSGGQQVVPLQLEVADAPAGSYRVRIEIALDTGLVIASPQVPLVVKPLAVSVRVEGSLDGLSQEADRAVMLIATVEDAVVRPVDLNLRVDRAGLPEQVTIQTLETASVRRTGDLRVPVKFRVGPGATAGTWHLRVSLSAEDGVVIDPNSVDLTVVVPEPKVVAAAVADPSDPQRTLWGLLGLAALVLTAVTAVFVGRSKDDLLLQVNG